jgi:hypothetical protein
MLTASYTMGPEYARGYAAAAAMTAYVGRGGHWVLVDRDAIGLAARPATVNEQAGIAGFYGEYAPALQVGTRHETCVKCGGTGLSWEPGEFGEEATVYTCGVCGGRGYHVEAQDAIAY